MIGKGFFVFGALVALAFLVGGVWNLPENGGDQYCRFQYMWDATFDAANSKLYVTQTRVPADDRDESIIHVLQIN